MSTAGMLLILCLTITVMAWVFLVNWCIKEDHDDIAEILRDIKRIQDHEQRSNDN